MRRRGRSAVPTAWRQTGVLPRLLRKPSVVSLNPTTESNIESPRVSRAFVFYASVRRDDALGATRFAGAIAVDDAAFGEIVGGHFEIDAITEKNFDAVTTEATGEVREHRVAVLQLDGERRARVNLTNRPENLKGCFLRRFGRGHTGLGARAATTWGSYDPPTF